ncbi:MAG: alpha-L-rhamnosidase, partial [Negativicutes bacterium]|nr:alpha-L-rhamnosidase [Negativicutes bacterium]
MKRTLLIPTLLSILLINLSGQELSQPNGLTVNFIASVENVYLNGYPVITALSDAITQKENYHFADIRAQKPFFGWILPANQRNRLQESYQILVSSSRDALLNDKGDLWDSGKVMSNQSTNVLYEGKALEPQKVYYWKVKFWDNHGYESAFSKVGQF